MKIAAKVEYLGLHYFGFQRQNKEISVQKALEETLSSLLSTPVSIHGAGRTDRGVSAKGQVISFEVSRPIGNLESFRFHWNRILPNDISIKAIALVDDSFDARHSSIGKSYSYSFSVKEKPALYLGRVAYLGKRDFDDEAYKEAMKLFLGEHCFQNFTTKKEDIEDFIRIIESIETTKILEEGYYQTRFKANGFMTYQIRFMMGAALKVGFHIMDKEEIAMRLEDNQRNIMPFKAPAEGLCLEEVIYEQPIFA